MSFIIDMVSGEILEETSANIPKDHESCSYVKDSVERDSFEPLLPTTSESSLVESSQTNMPQSVLRVDIDTFLDEISSRG